MGHKKFPENSKIIFFLNSREKKIFLKSDTIAANYAKAAGFKREIDWAHYEANVSKSGFVADFKVSFDFFWVGFYGFDSNISRNYLSNQMMDCSENFIFGG